MELKDLFLAPVYLFIVYVFAYLAKIRIKDHKLRKYFIPALTLKIAGALCVGLIYQFYYSGQGDTFAYYGLGSKYIWKAFNESPLLGLKLLFDTGGAYHAETIKYASNIYFYNDRAGYFIVRLAGLFGMVSFHCYSTIAIGFAVFSFLGVWKMFVAFYQLYPALDRQLAISIFFIPSVFFWGSGLLKDSITLGALGWLFYAVYNLFIVRKEIAASSIYLFLGCYILAVVKIYILLCFIPAASIWIFITYSNNIKYKLLKILLKPLLLVFAIAFAYLVSTEFSKENKQYSLDNIANTAKVTADWVSYSGKLTQGSNYDLGEYDASFTGLLKKFVPAVWVSLYRPYLWEVKNVVMLMAALESLFLVGLTIFTFYKTGIIRTFAIIKTNAVVLFCFIFSIAFAFAVGISTYNFGSLVRYKIPLIPFFAAALFIIIYEGKRGRPKHLRNDLPRPIAFK
ncbi:MAG TPA: hypothetical protein VF691_21330 [Cytophagaceae bacterium]|jgi:hypothetical protein